MQREALNKNKDIAGSMINIVLLADHNYIKPLAVTLQSFFENLPTSGDDARHLAGALQSRIFLISSGLTAQEKEQLDQFVNTNAGCLYHLDLLPLHYEPVRPSSSSSSPPPLSILWQKLLLPKLLPQDLDSVLYLDSDILIKDQALVNVYTEFDEQIKSNYHSSPLLQAVQDIGSPIGDHFCEDPRFAHDWPSYQHLPSYFNAGMMMLNLKAMRQRGTMDNLLAAAYKHEFNFRHVEQDVMNLVLVNEWYALPFSYNAQGLGTYAKDRIRGTGGNPMGRPPMLYTQEEYTELERHAHVIHFTGDHPVTPSTVLNPYAKLTFKPWSFYCPDHPWRDEYFRVLDRTPWQGWRPEQTSIIPSIAKELVTFMDKVEENSPPPYPLRVQDTGGRPSAFSRPRSLHELINHVYRMSRPKVFGIGMNRTGTSSLGRALSWLNYKTTDALSAGANMTSLDYFDLDSSKWINRITCVEKYLAYLDAFIGCPWMYVYKELDRRFAGSQFILTIRASSRIVAESEMAHWKQLGLDKKYKAETGKEMEMEMFIDRYEEHNREVMEYFKGRGDDFLVLCLEEEGSEGSWNRLCTFLGGLAVPDLPFPHLNARIA